MHKASQLDIIALLEKYDEADTFGGASIPDDGEKLQITLSEYFDDDREERLAVLGIDIYQYSKFDVERQRLVPSLFRWLYDRAADLCRRSEQFLFQKQDFDGRFISTGDGGFQILDTPLHSLAFAIFFQLFLSGYNAYYHFPKLRSFLGPLTVRYAITFDLLFQLDANFYGPAIINNARIMSRDTLNRCLVDENTMEWFRRNIATIETLLAITESRLYPLSDFSSYDQQKSGSMFFPDDAGKLNGAFRAVNAQKIGVITAKSSQLDIYNLHVQTAVLRRLAPGTDPLPIIVALGNLNTAGISG
jgi:hypothetical protein